MSKLETMLLEKPQISDYKINIHNKASYELFFVKGDLETVRCTNTCDTKVTIYAMHGNFLGDAQFYVYPSTTDAEIAALIEEAVGKAMLIENQPYSLPSAEEGCYCVESNFSDFAPEELAAIAANTVFDANTLENGTLNSVEVFVNRHDETVINSKGIRKTQTRYDAMVEAIPTFNGENQSVELYEQYNFSHLDTDTLCKEIANMMNAVKARYEAKKLEYEIDCSVILNKHELAELFENIAQNLNYSSVYNHASIFQKGDSIQKEPDGDLITIQMLGEETGNIMSAKFDNDGLALKEITIVENGTAVNYFGDNRFGQYLGETPTGNLRCLHVQAGTFSPEALFEAPYLEVISMSGLQIDFFSDYFGGEVRLAYYHCGKETIPVTGISISGSASDVLKHIRFSKELGMENGYIGPAKALLKNIKVF